ncbi:MAG: hypothetical protein JO337_05385 [Acidimicrobiales bacterium]|nr:hypothetical protein [Acidimicrobiales bacterium]
MTGTLESSTFEAASTFEAGSDLGLHVAARTVLERCPEPTNPLEVAVVLETCGYTASRAARLGAGGLMELGEQVLALMPLYAERAQEPSTAPGQPRSRRAQIVALLRSLGACGPLLVGLTTTFVAGVSFWSSAVAIPSIAVGLSLSTAVSLIVIAPFVQGFGRRAGFYLGLDDEGILAFVHRWTLEVGLVMTAGANIALYVVRNDLLGAGSPAANRLGLSVGLAVGALQVGLASFYVRRAYLAVVTLIVVASGLLVWRMHAAGAYVDPVALAAWQARFVAVLAAATCAASAWWLLRAGNSTPGPVWKPRPGALIKAVAPYSGYGLAYFVLLTSPQLIAGGAWQGRYEFDAPFAFAAGSAVVVLLPALALAVAATEEMFEAVIPDALAGHLVAELGHFREELIRYWRRRAITVGISGAAAAFALVVVVPWIDPRLGGGLVVHQFGLRASCAVAMAVMGVASFAAQLLLTLSQPRIPLIAAAGGAACFLVASGACSLWWSPATAAAVGLAVGSIAFAGLMLAGADGAFRRSDLTYYRTM